MWYNVNMKKKRVVIGGFLIIVVALLLEACILKYVNDKNAYRTSKVLADRVVTVLKKMRRTDQSSSNR